MMIFGRVPHWLAALACAVGLGACDGMAVAPPPAGCTQTGAQCQLPGGPLGVCQQTTCDAGATPPCFVCTSQH